MCLSVVLKGKQLPFFECCDYYKIFSVSNGNLLCLYQGNGAFLEEEKLLDCVTFDYRRPNFNDQLYTEDDSIEYEAGFHAWVDLRTAEKELKYLQKMGSKHVVLKRVRLSKVSTVGLQKMYSIRAYAECVVGKEMFIYKDLV